MGEPISFIVVEAEASQLQQVLSILSNAYPHASVAHATDARTALYKMQNVAPDVLITSAGELGNGATGLQLVESVCQDRSLACGIVLLSGVPIPETYTQDILTGRLQVCSRPVGPKPLVRAVGHAFEFKHKKFTGSFEIYALAAGEFLFQEGDKADLAFLVKSGRLRASRSREGKKDVLGDILPGEFVGEMAYINGDNRSADVEVVEGCELIQIPLTIFDSLLFTKPAWSMAMMKTLSKRLKVANR